MRHIALQVLFLFATLCAIPSSSHASADFTVREWTTDLVRLHLDSRESLVRLTEDLSFVEVDRESFRETPAGVTIDLRVTAEQRRLLQLRQIELEDLVDLERRGREEAERSWLQRSQSSSLGRVPGLTFPLATYPTHAEIGALFEEWKSQYPNLARGEPWGTSGQGRELWELVISDQVETEEAEPEVRLAAGIHGNEPVDMVLLLNFAHQLLSQYGKPGYEHLTALVDETQIHFMPLINPDGYIGGYRSNAAGYDLNRNFPEPTSSHLTRQPETLDFMDHAFAHDFVISQTGHGGALVVNYPWDYTYTRAPDDAALIELSLEYSTTNLPMYNGSFSQGITNGADWYVTNGSLQDWSYDQTGCIDLTIEVSNVKWPSASALPGLWSDNEASLANLVKSAHYGVNGRVLDAVSGQPLDAVVTAIGNTMPVATDPDLGDYYKLLPTGSFDLRFESIGYTTRVIEGVDTQWGVPTVLDVGLLPEGVSAPAATRLAFESIAPNPFNPRTEVRFVLGEAQRIEVLVVDARGRRLRTLEARELDSGRHSLVWDGRDDVGRDLASGVYFVRLIGRSDVRTAKVVLLR